MAPTLSDLRYWFFGGGSAAEYAYLQSAYLAGIGATDLVRLGYNGNGSPEGIVDAPFGAIYTDELTGRHYEKQTASGTLTGWVIVDSGGGGGAPNNAHYITTQAEAGLTQEVPIGSVIIRDTIANITLYPASILGRLYVESNGKSVYYDTGSAWVEIGRLLIPGVDVQAYDAELAAIAGLVSAANKLPYFTGLGTAALTDLTAFVRTILDDPDAATVRGTIGAQALDATLTTIGANTGTAADRGIYFTGADVAAEFVLTAAARTVLDDATVAAMLTTMGGIAASLVDAKGDIFIGTANDTVARKAVGSNGQTLIADSSQGDGQRWAMLSRCITFIIDGGGATITTGAKKAYFSVPFACTITKARLLADQTGSIVIDVWKDTYANFPPTVADTIVASAKPTLSAAQKSEDSTLTGWTKTLAAGDVIEINVDSITTCQKVRLDLFVDPT
jgi:hypothetical protein